MTTVYLAIVLVVADIATDLAGTSPELISQHEYSINPVACKLILVSSHRNPHTYPPTSAAQARD
jgi:hypothetical protein